MYRKYKINSKQGFLVNYPGLRDVNGSGNQISSGSALISRMTSKSKEKIASL